jgi:dihydrofolate reductase
MANPTVSLIAALTKDRSIGSHGDLVVRISDDLKRFKALTMGNPIIMGRKTFESIGRPLPGRTNLVVTHNPNFQMTGVTVCSSLDEAIQKASTENKEIFVIGGGQIYAQALPKADKLYLTLVESDAIGEIKFPDYSQFKKVIAREDRTDEKTGLKYSWIDLER